MKLDDQVIGKVENPNAKEFLNVKVWSGLRKFFPHSSNVVVRNLYYKWCIGRVLFVHERLKCEFSNYIFTKRTFRKMNI